MKKLLLLILFIFISIEINSQEKHNFSVWANVGLGVSLSKFSHANGGLLANYGLSESLNGWMLSLKHRNESEFLAFTIPAESFKSTSILFGLSVNLFKESRATQLNANILIGGSFISITERGNPIFREVFSSKYTEVHHSVIGLPIEFEMQLRIPRYFGFSIMVYSNINSFENLFGFGFNLLVGKM
jgi:hypothetical protein